jgi:hypothetical protein
MPKPLFDQDTDQGFSEEVKSGGKASKEYSAHAVAKFAQVGSREYLLVSDILKLHHPLCI